VRSLLTTLFSHVCVVFGNQFSVSLLNLTLPLAFIEPSGPIDLDLGVCERNEDINFVFTGLDIKGKVSSP